MVSIPLFAFLLFQVVFHSVLLCFCVSEADYFPCGRGGEGKKVGGNKNVTYCVKGTVFYAGSSSDQLLIVFLSIHILQECKSPIDD